jgi:CobQ-like glutamine amidotransferase family enzyme
VKLRIAHLYPRVMNVYGDRGNILCLVRRCRDRGIDVEVDELGVGDRLDAKGYDLIFVGGAQDREQRRVADDLRDTKGDALREAVEAGVVTLAVCGGYQLFGRFYRESTGVELPGLGLLDIWTEHPGPAAERLIGNVVADLLPGYPNGHAEPVEASSFQPPASSPQDGTTNITLVGFENHGGRTYLGDGATPLARVCHGHGNNGRDRTEGARYRNCFGTYLHGSLLPKNPAFADLLLTLALRRTHGADATLSPLDDRLELAAHAAASRLR